MRIVAGIFSDRDRALLALDELRGAGFDEDAATILASPTSAGEAAEQAAGELPRPRSRMIDLGAAIGGQAELGFPEAERSRIEERVAQGDVLIRVDAPDDERF